MLSASERMRALARLSRCESASASEKAKRRLLPSGKGRDNASTETAPAHNKVCVGDNCDEEPHKRDEETSSKRDAARLCAASESAQSASSSEDFYCLSSVEPVVNFPHWREIVCVV